MPSDVTFRTASGGNPVEQILTLVKGSMPTEGDCLYAAQRQRTRIVERTLQGVDVDGTPFEPYATDRPYYYYPNGRIGSAKFSKKQNKAAVRRVVKKLAPIEEHRFEHAFRTGRFEEAEKMGGYSTGSGQGIRFSSYSEFKASLGRAGVDLTGPRAPHMLQSIAVKVNGNDYGMDNNSTGLGGRQSPGTEFVLGIYGEPAGRAAGHNTGENPRWKRRHQRRFFGSSVSDINSILDDLKNRIMARLKGGK